MPAPYKGGCGCGAVRYTVNARPMLTFGCHCTECRKRTGSAFGISAMTMADAVTVDKGTTKQRTRTADSGNEVTIHFCGECGSSLYLVPVARPQFRVMAMGTFDDPSDLPVQLNIWTASALPWVALDPDIPNEPHQPNFADYLKR